MEERQKARINLKFGKFADPFAIVLILAICTLSILSVSNLTPQTHSTRGDRILGVTEESKDYLQPIYGEHNYITEENLDRMSESHYKYSTFIKPNMKPRISKPILQINSKDNNYQKLKSKTFYSNDSNSRVSLVDANNNTSYLILNNGQRYTQNLPLEKTGSKLYLAIENTQPVFFNQYIEIHFFLE